MERESEVKRGVIVTPAKLLDRLFSAALEADRSLRTRDELTAWLDDLESRYPVTRCHDWRNHLPDAVFESWNELSLEARLVAFIPAAAAAHSEDWD